MYGFLQGVRSRVVCVWGCSCIQSLEAATSVAHADHRSAHVQRVSHLQVEIVPLLTGCQRDSNPVACKIPMDYIFNIHRKVYLITLM